MKRISCGHPGGDNRIRSPLLRIGMGLLIVLPVAGYQPAAVAADAPPPDGCSVAETADSQRFHPLGAAACSRCHTRPLPEDEQPDASGRRRIDFVLLNEFAVWKEHDRHARAGQALQGELARRMGELLQVDVTAPAGGCVACHAPLAAVEQPKPMDRQLSLNEGVSCEVCHGHASEWLGPHFTRGDWRTLPAKDKLELGFRDVGSTANAARLCAACHIGDSAADKVVTHDMYAVGHPPIPSFELSTWTRQMPVHWRPPEEKPQWIREQLGHRAGDSDRVRQVAIGSLVSLQQTLELLACRAEAAEKSGWPDFAQFDCYACHHELQRGSWRLARVRTAQPGRPMYRSWPEALPLAVLAAAGRDSEPWKERLGNIAGVLSDRPFGDPYKLAAAARAASRVIQTDLQLLAEEDRWTAALGKALLDDVLQQAGERSLDFDTARQWGWAVRSLMEIEGAEQSSQEQAVEEALQELAELLVLGNRRETNPADAARSLRISATYDADAARRVFAKLQAARQR